MEKKSINYIIAARMYAPIQHNIASRHNWLKMADGLEIADTNYKSPNWQDSKRMIIIRQYVPTRPKATGRTLSLFKDEGIYRKYRYSCFITNLNLPAEQIWTLYRQRADAENRIKELKYDFGSSSFNVNGFYATEAALNFVMIAYNIISLFRQVVLNTKVREQMKTLRYKIFAIGGYIIQKGNQRILKLSLDMKRREWFTGLWMNTNNIKAPFIFDS
ncbi:MAG: transposase [Saprospiraceae bacterium]|nr:transposase [Candidatus Defluviibacterium haderslevense]